MLEPLTHIAMDKLSCHYTTMAAKQKPDDVDAGLGFHASSLGARRVRGLLGLPSFPRGSLDPDTPINFAEPGPESDY
jgi:hypothetical protein